jgi:uncharacterized protein (TIGR04255 family)
VTLYVGALTIELADYRRYEDLKTLTEVTLAALGQQSNFLRSTRMGLRYINEIESTLIHGPDDKWHSSESWASYINSDLLNSVKKAPGSLCAYANRGSVCFHSRAGEEHVSVDYGIHPEGMGNPDDVLLLEDTSGPCFVLDIDAFRYSSPKREPPENPELIQILDRLHEAVEVVFQWSVTDRMREVFRVPARDEPGQRSLLPASNG